MKAFLWAGLWLLTACGGKEQQWVQAGAGGNSPSAGSANGDAGAGLGGSGNVAGSGRGGSGTAGSGLGGSGTAGTSIGHAGASAGAGGKVPDPTGGSGGSDLLKCDGPFHGPSGRPRSDGPADLGGCAAITDAVLLARYKDWSARVPQGYYYEPNDSIQFWKDPCSKSVDETVARGPTDGKGTFIESSSSEWFYEADYCNNGVRRLELNLRCDYFDGNKLANPTVDRLAFLAGLLWWSKQHNNASAVLLGHAVAGGNAVDIVELCTLETSFGDFGLCDELRLQTTNYNMDLNGRVTIGATQTIRTVKGKCN